MKYKYSRKSRSWAIIALLIVATVTVGFVMGSRGNGPLANLFAKSQILPITPMSDVPELNAAAAAQQAKNAGLSTTAQQQAANQAAKATVQKLIEKKVATSRKTVVEAAKEVAKEVVGVEIKPADNTTGSQVVSQIVEKVVETPTYKEVFSAPPKDVSELKTICGQGGNVPMYPGFTYPSGYAARKDGSICRTLESGCDYRHCVSWSDKCVKKDVICGDALAADPTKVVVSLGGAYGASTNGTQVPVASTCTTNKGPVPSGSTRLNDKGVKEYCLNGVWKAENTLATDGVAYCKTLYPNKNYIFDKNLGQCVAPTNKLDDWAARKKACEDNNGVWKQVGADQYICEGRQANNCPSGTILNPTTGQCINTSPSCKDGVFKQATLSAKNDQGQFFTKWIIVPCSAGCNPAGTACNPDTPKAEELKCSGNTLLRFDLTVKPGKWVQKEYCQYGCNPAGTACNRTSSNSYLDRSACEQSMPSTQECVEVAGGVFSRIPKRNTISVLHKDNLGIECDGSPAYKNDAGEYTSIPSCSQICPTNSNGQFASKNVNGKIVCDNPPADQEVNSDQAKYDSNTEGVVIGGIGGCVAGAYVGAEIGIGSGLVVGGIGAIPGGLLGGSIGCLTGMFAGGAIGGSIDNSVENTNYSSQTTKGKFDPPKPGDRVNSDGLNYNGIVCAGDNNRCASGYCAKDAGFLWTDICLDPPETQ